MTVRAPLGPLLCAGAAGRDPSDGRQSMPANVGPYVDPIWVALQDVMQKRAIFIGGPRWDRTSDTLIKRNDLPPSCRLRILVGMCVNAYRRVC